MFLFSQEKYLFEGYWDWEGIDAIVTMKNTLSEWMRLFILVGINDKYLDYINLYLNLKRQFISYLFNCSCYLVYISCFWFSLDPFSWKFWGWIFPYLFFLPTNGRCILSHPKLFINDRSVICTSCRSYYLYMNHYHVTFWILQL